VKKIYKVKDFKKIYKVKSLYSQKVLKGEEN